MPDIHPESVEVGGKTIRLDGEPRLLLAGDVHDFRLRREDWGARPSQLADSGGNTVASDVPWSW